MIQVGTADVESLQTAAEGMSSIHRMLKKEIVKVYLFLYLINYIVHSWKSKEWKMSKYIRNKEK